MQGEAALALAEDVAADPATKHLAGKLGGVISLREVLDSSPTQDSVCAAAVTALGVLCRDSSANACLLVMEKDLDFEDAPELPGLKSILDGGDVDVRVAAAEVQQIINSVHHIQRSFRQGIAKFEIDAPQSAECVLDGICRSHPAMWKDIIAHILVNQLLAKKRKRRSRAIRFGEAILLSKRDDQDFQAVREACLRLLINNVASSQQLLQVSSAGRKSYA